MKKQKFEIEVGGIPPPRGQKSILSTQQNHSENITRGFKKVMDKI
jgi:hypothetical protein